MNEKNINKEIAEKIALAESGEEEARPMIQLVVFVLHDELFAAPITQVVEIIKLLPLTRMPRTADFVSGILNLRGQVFPVIDLKKRLKLPIEGETERSRIVKAEIKGEAFGFVVDEVREVLRVPVEQVDDPPSMMEEKTSIYLKGVVRDEGRMILLLDLNTLFADDEALLLTEVPHG